MASSTSNSHSCNLPSYLTCTVLYHPIINLIKFWNMYNGPFQQCSSSSR